MVGNKVDLCDERVIDKASAKKIAEEFGMIYYEASAKENKGVNEVFEALMT